MTRLFLILLAAAVFGLYGCTQKDTPYRSFAGLSNAASGAGCDNPLRLSSASYPAVVAANTGQRVECYLSPYKVPGAEKWQEVPRGDAILHPDTYTLSFVEMPETGKALLLPEQLEQLKNSFSKDTQDVVMIYVHGWRHDANVGNGNAIRFRTILGYTRSALNQRCVDVGQYCTRV
ncbi:hypothetical protein [uncultured Tateyamaria sp.]|uniref:hypothetical protein n=1 Tax=uncultured Tateyamaria sp. TaxID=455651 RepID=UPI00260ED411|nr:hypothetical protein [uncultured Tateyamaria sp.]